MKLTRQVGIPIALALLAWSSACTPDNSAIGPNDVTPYGAADREGDEDREGRHHKRRPAIDATSIFATPSCTAACHGLPPAAPHPQTQYCAQCHGDILIVDAATNTLTPILFFAPTFSQHGLLAVNPLTKTCGSCHRIPPRTGRHVPHTENLKGLCSKCHGAGYSTSSTDPSLHLNGTRNVLASIRFDPVTQTCAGACHKPKSWKGGDDD